MTNYTFKCEICGHIFDYRMKRESKKYPKCPKCKGKTKKIISIGDIQYKGKGFHITDYGKGK